MLDDTYCDKVSGIASSFASPSFGPRRYFLRFRKRNCFNTHAGVGQIRLEQNHCGGYASHALGAYNPSLMALFVASSPLPLRALESHTRVPGEGSVGLRISFTLREPAIE